MRGLLRKAIGSVLPRPKVVIFLTGNSAGPGKGATAEGMPGPTEDRIQEIQLEHDRDCDRLGKTMREALELVEFLHEELLHARQHCDDPTRDDSERLEQLRKRLDAALKRVPDLIPSALLDDQMSTEEQILREEETRERTQT